jgi:hypothetical protein
MEPTCNRALVGEEVKRSLETGGMTRIHKDCGRLVQRPVLLTSLLARTKTGRIQRLGPFIRPRSTITMAPDQAILVDDLGSRS